ncbi:MAG: VIT domain-containing protein [Acidobacteriota bacterium]
MTDSGKQQERTFELPAPRDGSGADGKPPVLLRITIVWGHAIRIVAVALSALAVVVEGVTHGTASVMQDPFPTHWHLLVAALVPAGLVATWRLLAAPDERRLARAALVNGFVLAVGTAYLVAFLPRIPLFVVAIALLGLGLLGLAPHPVVLAAITNAVLISWQAARLACRPRILAHTIAGIVLGIAPLGLLTGPGVATDLAAWASGSPRSAVAATGAAWLSTFGSREELRLLCYRPPAYLPNAAWFTPGPTAARALYYGVTGRPFNEGRAPRFRESDGFMDFDETPMERTIDGEVGAPDVGAQVPGLTLAASSFDVHVAPDALSSYTEWTVTFANESREPREARALIALPENAVAHRLTLWINGEEREGVIGATASAAAAYQSVAVVQRRDPALCTWVSPHHLLLQCFPVPAGGAMKVKVGVSALPVWRDAHAYLRLPAFAERNFADGSRLRHDYWVTSPASVAMRGVATRESRDGAYTVAGALVSLDGDGGLLAIEAGEPHAAVAFQTSAPDLVMRLAPPSPPSGPLVLAIDGSSAMRASGIDWTEALAAIPPGTPIGAVIGEDEPRLHATALEPASLVATRELAAWIGRAAFRGGHDAVPALERAVALAGGAARIVWIHGPIPVASDPGPLFEAARRAGVRIDDFPVAGGPDRLLESPRSSLCPVPRLASATADLRATLAGRDRSQEWTMEGQHDAAGDAPMAPELLARVAAGAYIATMASSEDPGVRQGLVATAVAHHVISAVSAGVVLERPEQYKENGLDPVAAASIPSIPEPATIGLLLIAGGAAIGSRRRLAGKR